jgi:hypothetical protein
VSNHLVCEPTGDCVPSASIGIYRAPFWPVGQHAADARLVYSRAETLSALVAGD